MAKFEENSKVCIDIENMRNKKLALRAALLPGPFSRRFIRVCKSWILPQLNW